MMGRRPDVLPGPVLQLAHRPRVGTGRLYGGTLRAATGDAAYGLGWRSFTYGGSRLEGHSGAVEGLPRDDDFRTVHANGRGRAVEQRLGIPLPHPVHGDRQLSQARRRGLARPRRTAATEEAAPLQPDPLPRTRKG